MYQTQDYIENTHEIPPSGQISHAFSNHRNFNLLVCTVTFSKKIIFNSSYTEENNYFLLYELIQESRNRFANCNLVTITNHMITCIDENAHSTFIGHNSSTLLPDFFCLSGVVLRWKEISNQNVYSMILSTLTAVKKQHPGTCSLLIFN